VLAGVIAKLQTVFAGVAKPIREELAVGKTEDWVTRRTGHCSSVMLARCRRDAETVREHDLGWLAELQEHLPELKISNAEPTPSEPI
jgi:hypothetical protein